MPISNSSNVVRYLREAIGNTDVYAQWNRLVDQLYLLGSLVFSLHVYQSIKVSDAAKSLPIEQNSNL